MQPLTLTHFGTSKQFVDFIYRYPFRIVNEKKKEDFMIRIIANVLCRAGTRQAAQTEVTFCKTNSLNNNIVNLAEQTERKIP